MNSAPVTLERLMDRPQVASELNLSMVEREFPRTDSTVYLNTGSAGRKPQSVIEAINRGWNWLNDNPTHSTFLDPKPLEEVRFQIASIIGALPRFVLLVPNPTQALHLLIHSFCRKAGDELVTTTHEHSSVYAIARHLEESRGIVTRCVPVNPALGSMPTNMQILGHVSERTKLVLISEVSCATGWRPDLAFLAESLELLDVPLLVDGAHSTGHIDSTASKFPLWVGSGHKWLGGPNGTGFAYVAPDLVPLLEPVWLGDKYFERKDANIDDLTRFESAGTADVVRWMGLKQAFNLYQELTLDNIRERQNELVTYLRERLDDALKPQYRTPLEEDEFFQTALVTFHFPPERVRVRDLAEELWQAHKIQVRNDFAGDYPNCGIRVSCHYSVKEEDLDLLVNALKEMVSLNE